MTLPLTNPPDRERALGEDIHLLGRLLGDVVRDRLPCLDPLNHLQVELLRRYRSGNDDESTRRPIHAPSTGSPRGCATVARTRAAR